MPLITACHSHTMLRSVTIQIRWTAADDTARISRGAKVGSKVTLPPFVTIGEQTVIGSGTVVKKEGASYAVLRGSRRYRRLVASPAWLTSLSRV